MYDLSTRQSSSEDLDLRLPLPSQLDNVSALPLPIPAALVSGLITSPTEIHGLSAAVETLTTQVSSHRVELSQVEYAHLAAATVEASRAIRRAGGLNGPSFLDVHLYLRDFGEKLEKEGKKLTLVINDS